MNSIFDIYPNKRDLFYEINKADCGLYAIAGARKIGKTVLLKQLAESKKGLYITFENSFLNNSDDYNLSLIKKSINDASIICIDEIIEASNDVLAELFLLLKENYNKTLIIFTGSYPKAVSELCYKLGRGTLYNLYGLNYNEYCKWFGDKSLKEYLKYCMMPDNTYDTDRYMIDYMHSIVNSARDSWLNHFGYDNTVNKLLSNKDSFDLLMSFIKATILVSYTKLNSGNGKLSKIEYKQDFRLALQNELSNFNIVLKQESIYDKYDYIFDFLVESYLGLFIYDIKLLNGIPNALFNDNKPSIIFTQQWMLTVFDGYFHNTITDIRYAHLLEYYLMLSLSELGYKVGKYRNDSNDEELDIIAIPGFSTKPSETFAIECKTSPAKNINDGKLRQYCKICDRISINKFYIINSDYNNDKTIQYFDDNNAIKSRIVLFRTPEEFLKKLLKYQYISYSGETDLFK